MTHHQKLPLTAWLSDFICHAVIDEQARDTALKCFVDTASSMIAAKRSPVFLAAHRAIDPEGAQGKSRILFSSRSSPAAAAYLNGVAAHCVGMDDIAFGCHPSTALYPALLALGDQAGSSGKVLLDAWIIGYEVLAELTQREPGQLRDAGYQPVSLLGPLIATAAAARLLQLTPTQTSHALGIASSAGGGVLANLMTPTKAIHLGRVAEAAVRSIRLAQAGITAAPNALESPVGLLALTSPSKQIDLSPAEARRTAGQQVLDHGVSVKKYPACYPIHRLLDAAIDLAQTHRIDPASIRKISADVGIKQAEIAKFSQPATPAQAQFSIEYCLAYALTEKQLGLDSLTVDQLARPDLQQLITLTERRINPSVRAEDGLFSDADRLIVELSDGRTLDSGPIQYEKGHARNPMSLDEFRPKYQACVRYGGSPEVPSWERLTRLPELDNLQHL